HTFAAAGTFTVKLTVIDTAGRMGEAIEKLVVIPSDPVVQTTTLKVITQIAGGVSLTGAQVTVGAVSGTSDANGLTTLSAAPVGESQVVTVKKAGYVTQSVRANVAAGTEPQQVLVLLLPEKDTLSIADIALAQTINSNYLGASVKIPADAFVVENTGLTAIGAATLKLTPWDISGIDLQAMPGNGRALTAAGALVDLISAGMMSVEFFDEDGNKLQVAPGKTADIQMDLPAGTTSIGGNALSVGTEIPMWNFDEAQGLWIEEVPIGTVIATATGLAVKATVSHFSIWNWDWVTASPSGGTGGTGPSVSIPPDATSLNLSCVNSEGVLVACNVVGKIRYPGESSGRTWATSLPAAVTAIRNIPGNPTIEWVGTTAGGLSGTVTSGATGTAVIQMTPPNITNFVRCLAPNGTAVPCTVVLTAPLADGSTTSALTQYIPAEGATMALLLNTTGPLSWTASTGFSGSGNIWTRYNGQTTSGLTGAVTISLVAEEDVVTG
ncbi:MAG: astroprincin family protein, partial [Hydrogenophaga sp.]